jgi:hypothetical protein
MANNNGFPTREQTERIRQQFPVGTRVELVSMVDPYTALKPGDRGNVGFVDDTGTVFVDWDNGSKLGCVYGEDVIRRLPVVTEKVAEQIRAIRDSGESNMFDSANVQRIAHERNFYELVILIEENREVYAHFILTGEPSPPTVATTYSFEK